MAPPTLLLPSSFADPPIILRLSFGPLEGNPVISIIPTEGSPKDDGRQKLPGCRDVWPRRDRVGRLAGFALQPVRPQRSDVAGARRPGRDVRDTFRRRPPPDSGRQGLGRCAPSAPEGEPKDRRTRASRIGGGFGDGGRVRDQDVVDREV